MNFTGTIELTSETTEDILREALQSLLPPGTRLTALRGQYSSIPGLKIEFTSEPEAQQPLPLQAVA